MNKLCIFPKTQNPVYHLKICFPLTLMILSFWTDKSGQTVQTQIRLLKEEQSRLLKEEQSDQGLHCLLLHLHLFDKTP